MYTDYLIDLLISQHKCLSFFLSFAGFRFSLFALKNFDLLFNISLTWQLIEKTVISYSFTVAGRMDEVRFDQIEPWRKQLQLFKL